MKSSADGMTLDTLDSYASQDVGALYAYVEVASSEVVSAHTPRAIAHQ
jgi:hypothetical protein